MKIIKLGKQIDNEKSTGKRFNCPFCECSYIASDEEISYSSKVYPYHYCKCPNCHMDNFYGIEHESKW